MSQTRGKKSRDAFSKIGVRLVVGFSAAFFGMALFGALSYRYFVVMEEKLFFLSHADAMLNAVLEMRRYEKNYLLYHHEEDFQQALSYLGEFEGLAAEGREHIVGSMGRESYGGFLAGVESYRNHFQAVHLPPAELDASVAALREAGKGLIDLSETLVRQERETITTLLQKYRPLLLTFLVVLCGVGAFVAWSLIVRLVKPLQTIEEATRVVADGEFRVIPWPARNDEIGTLVQGFNRMVVHLRRNNEQMIQTEKLTSLGTLTSGVAHELNNPLNNISTSCQILLEEADEGVSVYHRELLQAIEDQVSKAKGIVSSLLEFARQREFELRPEDLRSVAEEALKLIKGEIPSKVEVKLLAPAGIMVELDKAHMVQALINLVLNSIQAMEGGGAITIRGAEKDGLAEIEVEDDGPGIPPEIMPRIFDPFFTTKEVGRGTGLGLSITYGIVERHAGRITVESPAGRGACFRIRLPLTVERR